MRVLIGAQPSQVRPDIPPERPEKSRQAIYGSKGYGGFVGNIRPFSRPPKTIEQLVAERASHSSVKAAIANAIREVSL